MNGNAVSVSIYVLPSEQGRPAQAILTLSIGIQALVEWSRDMGTWFVKESNAPAPFIKDTPLDQELADGISDHARELGVAEFQREETS